MSEKKNFRDLGLSEETLQAVEAKGFEEPTDIQEMTIPVMLGGNTNIIAQAQTGTGKTAAFGLPLIDQIDASEPGVKALVLAPTRELAVQVSEEINSLKGKNPLGIVPIYGGQAIGQQLRRLKKGVSIVVGTPGRVIDHLNRKTLDLSGIDYLILDEADEMLNMGFIEDMEEIMTHTPEEKKTLLFSATMPAKIKNLAKKYMQGYEHLAVKNEPMTTGLTDQLYFEVREGDKFEALCRIADIEDDFYGLVFCRTKGDVDAVSSHLLDRGYDADCIHGDISQVQREKTLEKFRKKRVNLLVATDVAARGIDVTHLTHVINYSLPHGPESYVHRIGRTGRAGNTGTAITFVTPREYRKLMFIQRAAGADIKKTGVPKVREILKAKRRKVYRELDALRAEGLDEKYTAWAERLLEGNDPTETLAALLYYTFQKELDPAAYGEIKEPDKQERDGRRGPRDSRGPGRGSRPRRDGRDGRQRRDGRPPNDSRPRSDSRARKGRRPPQKGGDRNGSPRN